MSINYTICNQKIVFRPTFIKKIFEPFTMVILVTSPHWLLSPWFKFHHIQIPISSIDGVLGLTKSEIVWALNNLMSSSTFWSIMKEMLDNEFISSKLVFQQNILISFFFDTFFTWHWLVVTVNFYLIAMHCCWASFWPNMFD